VEIERILIEREQGGEEKDQATRVSVGFLMKSKKGNRERK